MSAPAVALPAVPSLALTPPAVSVPRATLPVAPMVLLAVATWASLKARLTPLVSSVMLSPLSVPERLPPTLDPVAASRPS